MTWKGMLGASLALTVLPCLPQSSAAAITRIPGMGGAQPNGFSGRPAISGDGRYIAFESNASNLVPDDTNGRTDIFLYDTQTGSMKRVSVASDGTQANSYSGTPSISADGRYVVFESLASNLVANDENKAWDVFIHDTVTGQTRLVSASTSGNPGNGSSLHADISADGRFVTFESGASDLVAGDTNNDSDVFLRDLQTGVTTLVSVAANGDPATGPSGYSPTISAEGRYVAFISSASNLVATDTHGTTNVFVRDTVEHKTTLLSAPVPINPEEYSLLSTISADGKFVAFYSTAQGLAPGSTGNTGDVYLADVQNKHVTRVAPVGDSFNYIYGALSSRLNGDGSRLAFSSDVSNVVPGVATDTLQVYMYNRGSGAITLISATPGGAPGNSYSYVPSISADGKRVAFVSEASDLVPGDTNNAGDIFIAELPSTGFTLADAGDALRIAGGLTTASPTDPSRLGGGPITVQSAVHIARKVAGLEPNP